MALSSSSISSCQLPPGKQDTLLAVGICHAHFCDALRYFSLVYNLFYFKGRMPTMALVGLLQIARAIFRVILSFDQWWSEDESFQNIIQRQPPLKFVSRDPAGLQRTHHADVFPNVGEVSATTETLCIYCREEESIQSQRESGSANKNTTTTVTLMCFNRQLYAKPYFDGSKQLSA